MVKLQRLISSLPSFFDVGEASISERQKYLNKLVRIFQNRYFKITNIKGKILRAIYYDDLDCGHIEIWLYTDYDIVPIRLPINCLSKITMV